MRVKRTKNFRSRGGTGNFGDGGGTTSWWGESPPPPPPYTGQPWYEQGENCTIIFWSKILFFYFIDDLPYWDIGVSQTISASEDNFDKLNRLGLLPAGHTSNWYLSPMLLNFLDLMGSGLSNTSWPLPSIFSYPVTFSLITLLKDSLCFLILSFSSWSTSSSSTPPLPRGVGPELGVGQSFPNFPKLKR